MQSADVLRPTQTKISSIYSHFLGFVAHNVASEVVYILIFLSVGLRAAKRWKYMFTCQLSDANSK